MTTPTLTLSDFLLARIAEDEAVAREVSDAKDADRFRDEGYHAADGNGGYSIVGVGPARALADCKAKRKIVGKHGRRAGVVGAQPPGSKSLRCAECAGQNDPCPTLRILAQPYADHEDFRDEWRA